MQPKSMLRYTALVVVVSLLFANCKKGDAGPAGADGPAGPQGPQGTTGTANVIYSAWLDVKFTPDVPTVGDTVGFYATINAPKLTPALLNTGEFKVYINVDYTTNPLVYPLPYTDLESGLYISVNYEAGKINLYSNGNVSTGTDAGGKYQQYRYVLIPGGAPARKATIDWNDYNKVKETLGLKD